MKCQNKIIKKCSNTIVGNQLSVFHNETNPRFQDSISPEIAVGSYKNIKNFHEEKRKV